MRLSPFEAYCMFQALKLHFTTESYDYFRYNGKVKTTPEQFAGKRDKYFYHRLCRRYDADQIQDFLVANFLGNDASWVGNMLDDQADELYKSYMRQKQSLSYRFKNEIDHLFGSGNNPFKFEDNGYPAILNDYMRGDVSLDTIIILNDVTGCFAKFDAKLKGDYLWDKLYFKSRKFRPFIEYDKEKIKTILKQQLNSIDRNKVAC